MSENLTVSTGRPATTHVVAVTAYVFHAGRFLLLNRARPPFIWAPPGGRLEAHEDPRLGLIREVREETGIDLTTIELVDYWFGELGTYGPLLSLDFAAPASTDKVTLCAEHTAHAWATLDDLRQGHPPLSGDSASFRIAHFEKAFRVLAPLLPS